MTMHHIASLTFESGPSTSTVAFTSIPQTYTHLQLRVYAKGTTSNNNDWMWIKVNSNSTANTHYMNGTGSAVDAYRYLSTTPNLFIMPNATTANAFGGAIIDLLDYTNTNKNKAAKVIAGYDANGHGSALMSDLLTIDTTAITSIELIPWGLTAFARYSRFDLYGITSNPIATGA